MRIFVFGSAKGFAFALFILVGACSTELPPEELLARAESALAAGNYQAALIDARSALQQQPSNPGARRVVGEIELWRQNFAVAVEEFERALRTNSDPELFLLQADALLQARELETFYDLFANNYFAKIADDPAFIAMLARARLANGDLTAAEQTIQRAIQSAPEQLGVRLAAAEITARQSGNIRAAADATQSIVEDFPDHARAWALLGVLRFESQDYSDAATAFENAVRLNPNRHIDRMRQASALLQSDELVQAERVIKELETDFPNGPGVHLLLADLHVRANETEEALISINKVLNIQPRNPDALFLAGIINSKLGSYETARRNLTTFLSMRPDPVDAQLQLATVELKLNAPKAAETIARSILENDPMNTKATRILAFALSMLGDQAASMEAFERTMQLDPDSAITASGYGSELARSGNWELAIEQLRAASSLEPSSVPARSELTAALLASGDKSAARDEAQAFISDYPENPSTHVLAGKLATQTGEIDDARQHFENAIKLDSENVAAITGLATLALDEGDARLAREYYEKIVASRPDHLPTLLRLADIYETTGDLAAMETQLKAAIDNHPDAPQPRIALAKYRFAQRQYQNVVNLLSPVKNGNGVTPTLHGLLAKAYLALQDYASARAESQKLVDLTPADADALVLLALSEFGLERLDDAEDTLRAASKLSQSPQIRNQLISVLGSAGKFDAAREELNNIPAGVLRAGEYDFALGQIAKAEGDLSAAAEAFSRSLREDESTRTILARNAVLWQQGEQAEAIGELYDWLAKYPEDTEVLGRLANLHLLVGEEAAAAEQLEQLNKLMPNNLAVLNNLAWASRNTDPTRSLNWAKQAIQMAPNNPGIRDTFAMVLMTNGEAKAALAIIDDLIKNVPDQPGLSLHRAEILVALGREDDAREALDALIANGQSVMQAQKIKATLSP